MGFVLLSTHLFLPQNCLWKEVLFRKVKNVELDAHCTDTAVVIRYEMEASVLASGTSTLASHSKHYQKMYVFLYLNCLFQRTVGGWSYLSIFFSQLLRVLMHAIVGAPKQRGRGSWNQLFCFRKFDCSPGKNQKVFFIYLKKLTFSLYNNTRIFFRQ